MAVLIGLAVATVLAIGWGYGNLVAAVFLTLGVIVLVAIFSAPANVMVSSIGVGLLVVVWTPFTVRRLRFRRAV